MFFDKKKKVKGEISDRTIKKKSPAKKTTIFTKRNGFFEGYIVFFKSFFDQKKGQKVRFQTERQKKTSAKKTTMIIKLNGFF